MGADAPDREVFILDTTLATGNSAIAAIQLLKKRGVKKIHFICIIAAPEGLENLSRVHPDVDIYVAAKDREISEKGYVYFK